MMNGDSVKSITALWLIFAAWKDGSILSKEPDFSAGNYTKRRKIYFEIPHHFKGKLQTIK